ncbi:alpha/beta hydrolase [Aureimonas endophytica]|uniref:Alpha/beta hydrolase n=1 Tax=Aureimonas endophytica TaxID=2027858 RepID=A0A916ZKV3_9HYPH|nr:alpha/beta hydrolase [Aureimonas endophytica]GGE01558.1 alpha/beta hydrolase [Aureimonas endophytica]
MNVLAPLSDFSIELAPEMAELSARVLAEEGPQPDPTMLPPEEGRRAAAIGNRRWNVSMPGMERVGSACVPADEALGSSDVRLLVLVPPNAREGAILFVHGGGFAFCSPETHERCARVLAVETGLPVILPDYRLAPEHPFPAGLLDVVASWRAAFEVAADLGLREGPLILAGDSAGAGLCVSAMLHQQGGLRADAALLFYGVYDADFDTPSYRTFADGPGLTRAKMRRYWDFYVADAPARRNPLVAPLLADDAALAALPPLHLMAAGIDPLLSDTLNFEARLAEIGRTERTSVVPGVVHGFLQMSNELPQAREALRQAAGFVKSRL